MKKMIVVVAAALFALSFAGMSLADEQVLITKGSANKPSTEKERLVSETATVQGVDLATRIVTLKGPKGKVFDVKAGDEVRNLEQVKVGDQVKAEYYQSIAVEVLTPGQAPGGIQASVELDRAKLGEKPAGIIGRQLTVTAKVEAINKTEMFVTLKGPEGKTLDV